MTERFALRFPAALAAFGLLALPAVPALSEAMSQAPSAATIAAAPLSYPATRKGDVVETRFGEAIADPYRWLENDVRNDREVAEWVARENALTEGWLAALPQRDRFARGSAP